MYQATPMLVKYQKKSMVTWKL